MLKNKDIVCISPIDWDFLYQRHQILMEFLAKDKNRVFYIENINPSPRIDLSLFSKAAKRVPRIFSPRPAPQDPAIRVITPLVLPFKNKISGRINRDLMLGRLLRSLKKQGVKNPIVWTYLATSLAGSLIKKLDPSLLVYDCVFDAELHPCSPKDIRSSEDEIIRSSDIIFTDNHYLLEKCLKLNPRTFFLPPGVDAGFFDEPGPQDPKNQLPPGPRLCFFGGIDGFRLDLELIRAIALHRPDWSIILIGPVIKTDISTLKLKNVFFEPAVKHDQLASRLSVMDALILPYKIIPFSNSIFPAKIFECLATGKPVISTPLPQLQALGHRWIKIAKDKQEFISAIERSLADDTLDDKKARLLAASDNTWQKRYDEINRILTQTLIRKARS